ncbi:hypothetical protein RO3G_04975 [Rhizopus delemar RA 99-880]|uniref:Uncharacterized protein n=1 Tax=Rhizopus delemar (strain RA 99-880 / ATCC MYA-4621 / FGSC 9543 / NRRL 43880) TaxID=246409 RepID=I1BVP0_RHIO9|nr:hypothetical protein RO3G_04975 [Rhizopus delemar RA 99-880]|eukprot:EIE80270.1 hypothetical protein RO3G_04975 [Rhizopus delemar RA 99-880]
MNPCLKGRDKYINPRGKQASGALDIVMNTEERKRQIAICLCKVLESLHVFLCSQNLYNQI